MNASSGGSDASGGSKKRTRTSRGANQDFGAAVSDDEEIEFMTPQRTTRRDGVRILTDEMAEQAIHQGLNPARVAMEMDRLSGEFSNSRIDDLAPILEGYHDSGLNSSASSTRSQKRRLKRNQAHSSDAGSAMEVDSDQDHDVVRNPAPPLHHYPGFGDSRSGGASGADGRRGVRQNDAGNEMDANDFLMDLVNVVPDLTTASQPRNGGASSRNNANDRYRPSRYAASKGKNYGDGSESRSDKRLYPWQEGAERTTVEPEDYNQFVPGQHEHSLLYDEEKISMEEAVADLNYLRVTHIHWQKKFNRPQEEVAPEVSAREGKRVVKRTCNAAFLLLIELVRDINSEQLVRGGVFAALPNALPNDPPVSTFRSISRQLELEAASQSSSSDGANQDAVQLVNDAEPISLNTIRYAVEAQQKRLFEIWTRLINRTPSRFGNAQRQLANQYWGELSNWLDNSFTMVAAFYQIRFIDAASIGRMVSEFNTMTTEEIKKNEKQKFLLFVSRKMAALNFRRGPRKGYIYRQHFIDGIIPSNFWVRDMTIEKFLRTIISTLNGPQIIKIYTYASEQIGSLAMSVDNGDEGLFPVVCPMRGLFGFRNGILDSVTFQFYRMGTKAYQDCVTNSVVYMCVYNFFDGEFNHDGFSEIDGKFDWTDRLAPLNDSGLPNWADPSSMPSKHWSRVLSVPILEDNIRLQKWDLHTIANLWFAFGRLCHSIEDNLQFAPFLKGTPGTGKSTFLQFPILVVPAEFRAIIPANAEAVFGLSALVGKEDTFVKHLGAVLDMNGKFMIPTSQLNSLITGEFFTAQNKHELTRTAKADMPFVFAGNQFFDDKREEMPSKLRRFWQFVLNSAPGAKGILVNTASVLRAIPAYLRMVTEVYHEFFRLKHSSPAQRVSNATNIWVFASPYLKEVQMDAMSKVSSAARFIASLDWIIFTGEESDALSLESLRFASDIFVAYRKGNRTDAGIASRTSYVPNDDVVTDAIAMLYPNTIIEEWGKLSCNLRYASTPEILENGLECQLGDIVKTPNQLFALGLKIHPERLEFLIQHIPKSNTSSNKTTNMPPPHAPSSSSFATTSQIFGTRGGKRGSSAARRASPPSSQAAVPVSAAGRNPAIMQDISHLLEGLADDPDVE